jgi:hypothetical protein
LTALLAAVDAVTPADVLGKIETLIPLADPAHAVERKDALLGRAFAYIALVDSGRVTGEGAGEALTTVVVKLLETAQLHTAVETVCLQTLVDLVPTLSGEAAATHIAPVVDAITAHSPFTLALDLLLTASHRSSCKSSLKKRWGHGNPVHASNVALLIKTLSPKGAVGSDVHPVWKLLLAGLQAGSGMSLEEFWERVFEQGKHPRLVTQ